MNKIIPFFLAFFFILSACTQDTVDVGAMNDAAVDSKQNDAAVQDETTDAFDDSSLDETTLSQDRFDLKTETTTITHDDSYRYINSNGLPNHETGEFPNANNPNTITAQEIFVRVTLYPKKNTQSSAVRVPGIALNGILMEPGTAEKWGCAIPCQPGPQSEDDWNIEAKQTTLNLGLDQNNAHVQPTGLYHYHGVPEGLLKGEDIEHIGWAADGFPMYHSHDVTTSYRLKSGTRPNGPLGTYDGTYTQDYEYVKDSGDLDECNGMNIVSKEFPEGSYAYFLTDEFPFIPRCLFGTPDQSFEKKGDAQNTNQQQAPNQNTQAPNMPPQAAQDACKTKTQGTSCSFVDRSNTITGTCEPIQNTLACKPQGAPPPR